jgi:hypothetical protein
LAPFFVRLASKFEKSTNMTKNCFTKPKQVSQNAEFHADFKFDENVFEKSTKKSYMQSKFEEHE